MQKINENQKKIEKQAKVDPKFKKKYIKNRRNFDENFVKTAKNAEK